MQIPGTQTKWSAEVPYYHMGWVNKYEYSYSLTARQLISHGKPEQTTLEMKTLQNK